MPAPLNVFTSSPKRTLTLVSSTASTSPSPQSGRALCLTDPPTTNALITRLSHGEVVAAPAASTSNSTTAPSSRGGRIGARQGVGERRPSRPSGSVPWARLTTAQRNFTPGVTCHPPPLLPQFPHPPPPLRPRSPKLRLGSPAPNPRFQNQKCGRQHPTAVSKIKSVVARPQPPFPKTPSASPTPPLQLSKTPPEVSRPQFRFQKRRRSTGDGHPITAPHARQSPRPMRGMGCKIVVANLRDLS